MNYWLESHSHKDNGPIAACNDLQDPQPTNQTRDTVIDGKRSLMITEGIHWLINGFLPQL
jgi:hypothetical protein